MQINPVEEWQRLTAHYRGMLDGELEQLADSFGDLTETAQQILRSELRTRGLDEPGTPKTARYSEPRSSSRFAGAVDPDEGDDSPKDYTWKTPLCDCDTSAQAYQLKEVLRRAGIESWVEGARAGGFPRILVAADQLDEAIGIANQPIPLDIIEEFRIEVPAYVPPTCPHCGAEDPVLEGAEPTNLWLCEACGRQWSDPEAESDRNPGQPNEEPPEAANWLSENGKSRPATGQLFP